MDNKCSNWHYKKSNSKYIRYNKYNKNKNKNNNKNNYLKQFNPLIL